MATLENGFIKLYRQMTKWEWYQDANTCRLFLHLLLTVNYEDNKWQGKIVPRGSRITSYEILATELKLSVQQVRTSISKLKSTGEITSKSTNKYTTISIGKYNDFQAYQVEEQQANQQANQQTNNKQITNKQQTNNNKERKIKKDKKEKKDKEVKNNIGDDIEIVEPEIVYFDNKEVDKLFKDFLEHRKNNKVKNTDVAIKLLLKELNKHDDDTKIKMIERSITNNWRGIFEIKEYNSNKNKKQNDLDDFMRMYQEEENKNE